MLIFHPPHFSFSVVSVDFLFLCVTWARIQRTEQKPEPNSMYAKASAANKADSEIKFSPALNPNAHEDLVNKLWFNVKRHMGRRAKEGNHQLQPKSVQSLRWFMFQQPEKTTESCCSFEKKALSATQSTSFYFHLKQTMVNNVTLQLACVFYLWII